MKNIISKTYITLVFLLLSFVSFADGPGDTAEGVDSLEGVDPAPIGDYVWLLAVLGILLVFFTFKAINNKKECL